MTTRGITRRRRGAARAACAVLAALAAAAAGAQERPAGSAGTIAVLHWWTSGGEAKAVGVLKDDLRDQGYAWKDVAAPGGDGATAMKTLKARVVAGDAPDAAQVKGPAIQQWAQQGLLASVDAAADGWQDALPPAIDRIVRADGHYVAVPFSVHRVNWIWFNARALERVGAKAPATWPEFFALADKLKAAGIQPVAAGGQPWQDLTVWEDVVLSQGAEFYRKALVDLDPQTLGSAQMAKVFSIVRRIESYMDAGRAGRAWNAATAMVIDGHAGMQFMGDWAKGEFAAANQAPGKDYVCAPVPGTAKAYTFNADSFVFLAHGGHAGADPAQLALARTVMTPAFQTQFSLYKGSIPVRLGVPMDRFDACSQRSYADEQTALKAGGYVPSFAHGMAQPDEAAEKIAAVVTQFMNSSEEPKKAAADLAAAAQRK